MKSIEEILRALVVDQLDVEPEEVELDATFDEDLGADSLDRIELTRTVEDAFSLEIPDSDADTLRTFGELVAYVTARLELKTK